MMKYKSKISFFLKSIFCILILFFCAEITSGLYFNNSDSNGNFHFPNIKQLYPVIKKFDYGRFQTFPEVYEAYKEYLRPPEGIKYKKRPLIFFIDSFAYGYGLDAEQSVSAKLSEYAKRPVYNYSFIGWGVQHILWLLHNEKDLNKIQNPEYAIYIFIEDHYRRMIAPIYFPEVSYSQKLYNEKNGKFYPEQNIKFYYRSYLYRMLSYKASVYFLTSDIFKEKREEKFVRYLMEGNRLIQEKWPGIKFVVLLFPANYFKNDFDTIKIRIKNEQIKNKKNNIIIIDGREILKEKNEYENLDSDKYFLPNSHPTE